MNKKILLLGLLMLSLMATACVVEEPVNVKPDSSFYDCIDMCGELKEDKFFEDNMEICTEEIYQNYYDWTLFEDRDDIRRDCTVEFEDVDKLDFKCMTDFCNMEVSEDFDEYCFEYCS